MLKKFTTTISLLAAQSLIAQTDEMPATTPVEESRLSSSLQPSGWLEAENATGNWLGGRDWLADRGLAPYVSFTGQFLANVDGGIDDGSAWEALVDFGLDADLEKLLGWKGGTFFINAFYFHGNDLSGDYVGDFNGVSNIFTNTDLNLYNIYFGQSLLDDAIYLKAGQIAADDDFMVSDTALLFINSCFGPMPTESGNISAPIYPLAAPGALARGEPVDGWYIQAAVYAGDAGPNQASNHGFEWRTGGSAGWAWFGETGVEYDLCGEGIFKLGGYYATGDFTNYATGAIEEGIGAVYGMIDHELLSADDSPFGLNIFCRGSFSPDKDIATVSAYVDGGVALSHVFLPEDSIGIACSHTWFADDYRTASLVGGQPVTGSETVIEATYAASVTNWLSIQPDVQYIINPHYSDQDALVIGIRCAIVL